MWWGLYSCDDDLFSNLHMVRINNIYVYTQTCEMAGFQSDGSWMFKNPRFFNLVESCRKAKMASDVLSIPHSTEQRGNPTKASGRLD